MTEQNIEFIKSFNTDGGIDFTYSEPRGDGVHYKVDGIVPLGIVKRGEEAILKYASRKVKEAKKKWRKHEAIEDNLRKNHIPIQTKYKDRTLLEGRIVEATSRFIRVELDKPLQGGESHINFGMASAMAGHYVFGEGHKISPEGYDAAYKALCWAYQDVLDKPRKDLVERLNQRNS